MRSICVAIFISVFLFIISVGNTLAATAITAPGTYTAGDYKLGGNISGVIVFNGTAHLDLAGYTINAGSSGNTVDFGVTMNGANSIIGDSIGGGKVTSAYCGIQLNGAGSKIIGVDLSNNRYMGCWLHADDCSVLGGRIGYIAGYTVYKYAIGVQCDHARPIVDGVRFDEMYFQAGYTGTEAGEGLAVNFAGQCRQGTMKNCVCINSKYAKNTYGFFGGSGGGHIVVNNIFINFWRVGAHDNSGTPNLSHNFAKADAYIAGGQGISCNVGTVEGNMFYGYERAVSSGRSHENYIMLGPVVAPQPASAPQTQTEIVLDLAR